MSWRTIERALDCRYLSLRVGDTFAYVEAVHACQPNGSEKGVFIPEPAVRVCVVLGVEQDGDGFAEADPPDQDPDCG